MITDYYRPTSLEEALTLLASPNTVPLGGGTLVNSPAFKGENFAVVDLQALGLNAIQATGNTLEIDACVTLQQLLGESGLPAGLVQAIKLDAPLNIRNMATVAGALVAADGRSTFAAALLALDAKIEQAILDNSTIEYRVSNIGDFLPLKSPGLITKITIPTNVKFAFESVARTPADKPILCAALAQWSSGRSRLALGGWGKTPLLAMDGLEPDGLDSAARNACHESSDDFASAAYRMDVAATLAKRCFESNG